MQFKLQLNGKKWENRKAPVWGDAGYLYWA